MSATPAPGTHLVVGRGVVGTAIATQLAAAGLDVVLASRTGTGPADPRITLARADAVDVESLLAAAPTAAVVYNAVNPQYHRWPTDWPPMAAGFLAYAERTGAVHATVSNLYVYGPVDGPMREDTPLDPKKVTADKTLPNVTTIRIEGDGDEPRRIAIEGVRSDIKI
mgnify:CR=1 FL=1